VAEFNKLQAKLMIALVGELYGLIDRTADGAQEESMLEQLYLVTDGSTADKRGERIMALAEKLLETKRGKIYELVSTLIELQGRK
jgi:hypothetical protein